MNTLIIRAAVETNEYENILIAKENYELILTHYNKVRYDSSVVDVFTVISSWIGMKYNRKQGRLCLGTAQQSYIKDITLCLQCIYYICT